MLNLIITMELNTLKKEYDLKKEKIKQRLRDFEEVFNKGNKKIFEELCFCILTPNASAKMGINAMNSVKPILYTGNLQDLQNALKSSGYRYPNKRAEYILEVREFIKNILQFQLKEKILSFDDKDELRDYIVNNIKGVSYKESSHFLRNIGFKGYCIIDKHILNCLTELDILESNKRPINKKQYLEIEQKMKEFSNTLNINIDELDLLLWSHKTGEILK